MEGRAGRYVERAECESRHSRRADACATLYAAPFEDRRNEAMSALLVLAVLVVQNSRKWKSDSEAMKKGARQMGR